MGNSLPDVPSLKHHIEGTKLNTKLTYVENCHQRILPKTIANIQSKLLNVGIDHVFASGAVVGRTTMHELGRPSLRATPRVSAWWRV